MPHPSHEPLPLYPNRLLSQETATQFEQLAQDQAASLATAQERQNELVAQVLALQQEVQEREQLLQVCVLGVC